MENTQLQQAKKREHKLVLTSTKRLSLTGLEKVHLTNENVISVLTTNGQLIISGSNIHISKLSVEEGILEAEGTFFAFKYQEAREKQSILKRVFK